MKIFEFDVKANKKVGDVLDNRARCSGHGSARLETRGNTEWYFLDNPSAHDSSDKLITASQYGKEAICFCLGEFTAGTDTAWVWVVTK